MVFGNLKITRVAAANIEEPGTSVSASTLHNTFGFDGEYESKLDFSKTTDQKVAELIAMQLLLLDEVSMLDVDIVASVFCCNSSYPDLGPFTTLVLVNGQS